MVRISSGTPMLLSASSNPAIGIVSEPSKVSKPQLPLVASFRRRGGVRVLLAAWASLSIHPRALLLATD